MESAIYSIKDTKTGLFNRPFYEMNDVTAIRNLKQEVNRTDQGNTLYLFPEDYQLYKIGKYNGETGHLEACKPELITTCEALVNQKLAEKSETARLRATQEA
jgi:hypothetical protein